jgi:hypothetical protein
MGLWAFSSDCYLGMDFHNVGTRNVNMWADNDGSGWNILQADNTGQPTGVGWSSLALNAWSHVAYVRHGYWYSSFVNGVMDRRTYSATAIVDTTSKDFRIGIWGNNSFLITGSVGIFRVSKGIARWTGNFNVPTQVYSTAPAYDRQYLVDSRRNRLNLGGVSSGKLYE